LYSLHIHDDAIADLGSLWEEMPVAAARISVLLQELEGNQDLLDRLTQHNYGSYQSDDIHISKWFEHWRKGKDIWRIKVWDLESKGLMYRIVYAFIPSTHEYHVLAVAPRDFNYETDHPITKRILRAYENL